MKSIKISTAQFEHKSGDKAYNLSVIDSMATKAASEGSSVIAPCPAAPLKKTQIIG